MLGPYIKSRGTRGTTMSANADLITVETYVQPGKTIENQFFIYGPKCKQNCIFLGIWEALGGPSMNRQGRAYPAFQLSSHPYLCTCEIRKQSDKNFIKFKSKIWNKISYFFHIWGDLGGPGGALTSNPGLPNL